MNGVAGPNIVFRGVNLHVMSATSEKDTSGLGNLIVGWDDIPPSPFSGYRSGSNDLICGDANAFPADGVFLAGLFNVATELGASVSGGSSNTASGEASSVSGGSTNQAMADGASISGSNGVTVNVPGGWSAGGSFYNP
jgi:hypothetical protein